MIELHLCLRSHSQRLASLLVALQRMGREAKLKRGCVEVHLFTECHDPGSLYYSEMWDTEENLCLMLCSEHFTRLAELMETAAEPPVLDFRTIAAIRGLEVAHQARQGQNKGAFTLNSGNNSYTEHEVNLSSFHDKTTGPQP